MFQNFHDLSVKQVNHLVINRKLFPSLGNQKKSKASVGFLCIQVGEDNSPLRWRLRESHTEYTLEQTNGSNELATAAISFLFFFASSLPFLECVMRKSLL